MPLILSNAEAAAAAAVVYISSFFCQWFDTRLQFLLLEMSMTIQATESFHRNFHFEYWKE